MSDFTRSLYSEQQHQQQDQQQPQQRTLSGTTMEDGDVHQNNHQNNHHPNPVTHGGTMRRRRSSRRSSGFRTFLQRTTSGSSDDDDNDDGNDNGDTRRTGGEGGGMAAAAAAAARAVAEEGWLSPLEEGEGDSDVHPMMMADNDEVLEQYRIMAQLEAHLRVKENTGFDMAEYQEQRRTKQAAAAAAAAAAAVNKPPGSCYLYSTGRLPPPILPEPRMVKEWSNSLVPEDRPLQAPTPSTRLRACSSMTRGNNNVVPEVCEGVVVRGKTTTPDGEHLVQCLGCKLTLRVHMMASLVSCPECSTISPACTRR
jgi:hypothetical protein